MKEAYTVFPAADIHGNAGSFCPGEKEQRYRPFCEKQRLNQPADAKQAT